jgi:hypothetical protein
LQKLSKEDIMAAIVTQSLTPSQQAAREFWRQAGADGMPPFYVMSQYYAQLSANSDNLPAVTGALDKLLTGLGYATDADTVFGELANGQGEELGYWAGRYCLFDSDGNRFDLVVGRNGATLTVPPALVDVTKLPAGTDMATVTVLSGAGFSHGVLQLANSQFQVSLRFTLPVSDASFDTAEPAAAMFQSTAPRCTGTFVVVGGGAAGSRPVNGKRGAWTQAGVDQTADGDPAAAWYGQYVLLDVTDVTVVKQNPQPVYIYNDPSFGLTFQWGNAYGGNVTYNNNVLQCADEDDDTKQYAMQFVAPQAGAAEINLAVITAGVVRSYKGYWVDRYPQPSPAPQARLAKRPMTAAHSTGPSGASGGGYSQAIDVSSLTPGDAKNKIVLPYGAVGNTYALSLNLTGCATTDTFSWKLTPGSGSNDAAGRAAIAQSGGANQTVLFSLANLSSGDAGQQLLVTVQLTKTSATPPVTYTLLFDIAVIQCDAISLAPTVPPPVVVGTPYTLPLAAHGARGNFTWSVIASSLPPGLTWDDGKHQLSGTVTDATQLGKAFSLVLGLAASDVIMDPLTASLGITVQPAPAVASDIPPLEMYLIYGLGGSGLVMMALAAFAINRFLAARANAKTIEALKAGNTNLENATRENPKLVSQKIVQGQDGRLSIIKDNIPYSERLIQHVGELQNGIMHRMEDTYTLYEKLLNYLADHPIDDPDAPVRDRDLNGLGYETVRDVASGAKRLVDVTNDLHASEKALTELSNRLRTLTTEKDIEIDEHTNSEPNEERLFHD